MTMKATPVRTLVDWVGNAVLYKLDDYVWYTELGSSERNQTNYVIVSAIPYAFDHGASETLVFPADSDGEPINMIELAGMRYTTSHKEVLADWGVILE